MQGVICYHVLVGGGPCILAEPLQSIEGLIKIDTQALSHVQTFFKHGKRNASDLPYMTGLYVLR